MQVFYTPLQSVSNNASYSPSAGKPAQLVAMLEQTLGLPRDRFVEPAPVRADDIARVHDAQYVRDVLACVRSNGFGNKSPEVAAALPYVVGSFVAAARAALSGPTITCSPTSGFHHAEYGRGEGFCTFNGLMVAAAMLKAEGRVQRVAVLDCDAHFGNGTEEIKARLGLDWVWTQGDVLQNARNGEDYLRVVDGLVDDIIAFAPDVVLYQAGADPHINDPLGGILTTLEMRRRDRMVFRRLCGGERRFALAWNLAGGYQRDSSGGILPVLELHLNTWREAETVLAEHAGRQGATCAHR